MDKSANFCFKYLYNYTQRYHISLLYNKKYLNLKNKLEGKVTKLKSFVN